MFVVVNVQNFMSLLYIRVKINLFQHTLKPTSELRFDTAVVRRLGGQGLPVIVKGGSLEDNPKSPNYTRYRKYPQKQSVQHHGNVFPVLFYLRVQKKNSKMLYKSTYFNLDTCKILAFDLLSM